MVTRLADSWSRKGIVQIAYTVEITVNQKGVPLCMYMVSNTTQWSTVCIDKMQLQIPEEKKNKRKNDLEKDV